MRRRVGMITPSSNSVLEPVTAAMLAGCSDVTAHFARLRVTEIALDAPRQQKRHEELRQHQREQRQADDSHGDTHASRRLPRSALA